MLEAGSVAVIGKEARNTFRLDEVTGNRKETPGAATGTASLYLFSFTVFHKRFRGRDAEEEGITGTSSWKNGSQEFLVTAAIYRNSVVP